jgi:hypothetical protein
VVSGILDPDVTPVLITFFPQPILRFQRNYMRVILQRKFTEFYEWPPPSLRCSAYRLPTADQTLSYLLLSKFAAQIPPNSAALHFGLATHLGAHVVLT